VNADARQPVRAVVGQAGDCGFDLPRMVELHRVGVDQVTLALPVRRGAGGG
jgi:hypothetical protein